MANNIVLETLKAKASALESELQQINDAIAMLESKGILTPLTFEAKESDLVYNSNFTYEKKIEYVLMTEKKKMFAKEIADKIIELENITIESEKEKIYQRVTHTSSVLNGLRKISAIQIGNKNMYYKE